MKKDKRKEMKLNPIKLGFAGGVIFGACAFLMTVAGILFNLYPELISIIADYYGFLGYDMTFFGALLGGVYAFIDGFIFFWLLGWLYNRF
ncbi:hypothetical protein HOD29_05725 [archaeon]|jgi:hypothetical protein|nr:hypothetical protein [archaeon]